jgi:hypothetical protein
MTVDPGRSPRPRDPRRPVCGRRSTRRVVRPSYGSCSSIVAASMKASLRSCFSDRATELIAAIDPEQAIGRIRPVLVDGTAAGLQTVLYADEDDFVGEDFQGLPTPCALGDDTLHLVLSHSVRNWARARRWGNAPRRQTRHELEYLQVHPHCLMFFVDDTGQEEFADSKFPVFGMGGCAIPAAAIDQNLRQPYRAVAADHSVRIRQQGYSALDANKYPDPPSSNVRIECVLLD